MCRPKTSIIENECVLSTNLWGPSWPWSYGSWIYNYQCNQCLSPLMLWGWISIRARCTALQMYVIKFVKWLATGRWFSPGLLVSFTNKTDCHDKTEILLKVVWATITQKSVQHFNVTTFKFSVFRRFKYLQIIRKL